MTQETIDLSVEEWIDIPSNPIQRDTELHARKAKRGHLSKYSETQKRVSAAVTDNGDFYKLDGHTRALLWERGELPRPKEIFVDLYYVRTVDDVIELYRHFDNQTASETAQDRLSGALSYFNISGDHRPFLQVGGTTALNVITTNYKSLSTLEKVEMWQNEIQEFTKMDINQSRFRAGILGAFLATMAGRASGKKNGYERVKEFWERHNQNCGDRVQGRDDGVSALDRFILAKKLSGGGYRPATEDCARTITACEGFLKGTFYKQSPKKADIKKYLG